MAPWKSHGQFNGWITSSGSCKFHLTGFSVIKEFYRQSHNLYRSNNVPNQAAITYTYNTCISAHACLKMVLRMCDSNNFDSHALTQINKKKMKKYYIYYFFLSATLLPKLYPIDL